MRKFLFNSATLFIQDAFDHRGTAAATFSHLMATSVGNALSALRSAISSHELQAPAPPPFSFVESPFSIKFQPRSCGSISAAATRSSTGFLCFKNCWYESPDAGLLSDNDFIVLYHAIQHAPPPSELAGRVLRDLPIEKLQVRIGPFSFFFVFLPSTWAMDIILQQY